MARAGRKRKNGPRHPGGQLKKPKKKDLDDATRTKRQPHRRALAKELRASGVAQLDVDKFVAGEEAESPIGRLWAAGRLNLASDFDSQAARDRYDAGNMFAQIVGAYRSVIEAPRDVAGSGRGFGCLDLLCRLAPEMCECARRKARYDRAFEALAKLSRRALMAVNRVAIHREPIGEEELVYLVAGLDELRRIFGLTERRKARHHLNAK
jgi:hypothetical protein